MLSADTLVAGVEAAVPRTPVAAAGEVRLYHTPCACSRVALNALEEIGEPYRETAVDLAGGGQRTPEYLAVNLKGKVPVLVDAGRAITETPVILHYLAVKHRGADLLPLDPDGRPTLDCLSDLVWLAGAVHPTMHRVFRPRAASAADPDGVRTLASAQLAGQAALLSARYAKADWCYGPRWSIVDLYVVWIFSLAVGAGFDLSTFPEFADLRRRVEARPSFQRAREVERAALAREGMSLPPGVEL